MWISNELNIIYVASGIILAFLIISLLVKVQEKSERLKLFLFLSMVIPIIATTFYLAGQTVAKNQRSSSGGPVHWHADYEIYNCGEKLSLEKPHGISNRVGESDIHEHGDSRIHLEGVIEKPQDADLGNFFKVVGGELEKKYLKIPTDAGNVEMRGGMKCPDNRVATLQVFVYKTRNKIVSQEKLQDPAHYIISPESQIPPGDCVIFEFTPEIKNKTDKMCKFYEIAIRKGEVKYAR